MRLTQAQRHCVHIMLHTHGVERRKALRILIADDNEGFRGFVRRVLNLEKDLSVVGEALDGPETVRKSEQLRPELVMIDLDLPGMDGLEVTRRIKAMTPQRRVVLFSSLDGREYREAAQRSGADGFLLKTGHISEMLSMVKQWSPRRAAGMEPKK